jgi:hypothetical protein
VNRRRKGGEGEKKEREGGGEAGKIEVYRSDVFDWV